MSTDDDINEPLCRVVCAAMRHTETGLIVAGARHGDIIMRGVFFALGYTAESPPRGFTTGFIDNKGEFLTREQAWIIAEKAGQIRKVTGTAGTLYSEDLY